MGWTMLYLFVALKLPILALGLLVWWAVKAEPEASDEPGEDGGTKRRPHPRRPLPHHPRRPRRGPHGEPAPAAPARVRTALARSRQLER